MNLAPPCDYETEVCLENEAFMQNSYLLDYDFHDFLRQLVVNVEDNVRITEMAVEFVCNALLHSREKNSITNWLLAFNKRFRATPETATWLLAHIPAHTTWNTSYLFTSPDSMARRTYVTLISQALSTPELTLDHLTPFLDPLLDMMETSVDSPSDEYFFLLRNAAEKSALIRDYFVQHNVIAKCVVVFVGRDRVPFDLKHLVISNGFASVANSTVNDYQFLLEAIGAMLQIPRRIPVALLKPPMPVNGVLGPVTLSDAAQAALSLVFDEFAIELDDGQAVMRAKELRHYFRDGCGVELADASITGKKIGFMLSTYGLRPDLQQLDKTGFLLFYTDSASKNTKTVLKDLSALGFEENLERPVSVEMLPTAVSLLAHMPLETRIGLQNASFFDLALDEDAESMAEIVMRLSVGDDHVSKVAFHCFIRSLVHSDIGWKGQPGVAACVKAVSSLLVYPCSYTGKLLQLLFNDRPSGLLTQAEERAEYCKRYPHNYQAPQIAYRIIAIVLELYTTVPIVKIFLDQQLGEWEWMYLWLLQASLDSVLGGRTTTNYRDPDKLKALELLALAHNLELVKDGASKIVVEFAGSDIVNGVYVLMDRDFDGCHTYTYHNMVHNKTFTLFRCVLPSGTHRWYISITPSDGTSLGTAADIDYYYVQVPPQQTTPPLTNWKLWTKNALAQNPPPQLRVLTPGEEENSPTGLQGTNNLLYDDSEEELEDVRANSDRFQALGLDNNNQDDDPDFI